LIDHNPVKPQIRRFFPQADVAFIRRYGGYSRRCVLAYDRQDESGREMDSEPFNVGRMIF